MRETDIRVAAMLDTFRRAPIERNYADPDLRAALGSSPPLEKMKMVHTPTPWALEKISGEKADLVFVNDAEGNPLLCCSLSSLRHEREVSEKAAELAVIAVNSHAANLALITELVGALETAQIALNDWLCIHASDMCSEEAVAAAEQRIGEIGTIGYISRITQMASAVLARAKASHGAGT